LSVPPWRYGAAASRILRGRHRDEPGEVLRRCASHARAAAAAEQWAFIAAPGLLHAGGLRMPLPWLAGPAHRRTEASWRAARRYLADRRDEAPRPGRPSQVAAAADKMRVPDATRRSPWPHHPPSSSDRISSPARALPSTPAPSPSCITRG